MQATPVHLCLYLRDALQCTALQTLRTQVSQTNGFQNMTLRKMLVLLEGGVVYFWPLWHAAKSVCVLIDAI